MQCPTCKKPSAERAARNSPWPFCTERCQLLDLGKWLNEEYRVPDGPDGSAGSALAAVTDPDEPER